MKNILLITALLVATGASGFAQTVVDRTTGDLTTIGGWDFNGYTGSSLSQANARYNQQYNPYNTSGTAGAGDSDYGTLYFTTNGGTFSSNRNISTSNASNYDLLSTTGLAVSNNSLGDLNTNPRSILLSNTSTLDSARAVFKVSTLTTYDSYTDINVAYSARNGATDGSTATISWSYSFDGVTFYSISGSEDVITVSGSAYNVYTADFSSIDVIEGVSTLYIGMEYTEQSAGATVFLDNVAIYGTAAEISAIPEPSTYAALVGFAVLAGAVCQRRRKHV